MTTVAVTGAAGLLGRAVVAALSREHRVIAIDQIAGPGIVVADLRDLAATTSAFAGARAVVHLAAIDGARTASEEEFVQTNVMATWNALKAAEQCGIGRVVLCSSISALGLGPGHPPACLPVPVDHARAPVSAYGISKHLGEVVGEAFARRGRMSVVCLRPCFIMFPHLVAEVARLSAMSDGVPPPELPPSGVALNEPLTPTRSSVSPGDAANAFAAALGADLPGFSTLFVAGPDTTSIRATPDLVQAVWGVRPPLADPALYASTPRAGVFDIAATHAALGWRPAESWADLLARAARQ